MIRYKSMFENSPSARLQALGNQFLANAEPLKKDKDSSLLIQSYIYTEDPKEIVAFLDSVGNGKHSELFKKLKHNIEDLDYEVENGKTKITGRLK